MGTPEQLDIFAIAAKPEAPAGYTPPMTYRERREAKAERLREWADKREQRGAAAYEASNAIADRIPFGQPILVGHHSERGARADQKRMHGLMDKACENSAKAAQMNGRADNIEAMARGAIYSDDTDAIERLSAKLATLEASRDRMKAYNATCRKGKTPDTSLLNDAERRDLSACLRHQAYQCPGGKFPPYVLSNLGATIRTTAKRLEELSKPDTGRLLTVKYGADCRCCGAPIEVGTTARYFRRTRELEHSECPA